MIGCAGASHSFTDTTVIIALVKCADIVLDNLTFTHGKGNGVFATNIFMEISLLRLVFVCSMMRSLLISFHLQMESLVLQFLTQNLKAISYMTV